MDRVGDRLPRTDAAVTLCAPYGESVAGRANLCCASQLFPRRAPNCNRSNKLLVQGEEEPKAPAAPFPTLLPSRRAGRRGLLGIALQATLLRSARSATASSAPSTTACADTTFIAPVFSIFASRRRVIDCGWPLLPVNMNSVPCGLAQ